jgi:hypothetical protein
MVSLLIHVPTLLGRQFVDAPIARGKIRCKKTKAVRSPAPDVEKRVTVKQAMLVYHKIKAEEYLLRRMLSMSCGHWQQGT